MRRRARGELQALATRKGWRVTPLWDRDGDVISVSFVDDGYEVTVRSDSEAVFVTRLRRPRNTPTRFFLSTQKATPPREDGMAPFATGLASVDRVLRVRYAAPGTAAAFQRSEAALQRIEQLLREGRRLIASAEFQHCDHRYHLSVLTLHHRFRFPPVSKLERGLPHVLALARAVDDASEGASHGLESARP
jgi:hypothetical protein